MPRHIHCYVHSKTGEEFLASEYGNFGVGHIPPNKKDLPVDGYPYGMKFIAKKCPAWLRNTDPEWIIRALDPDGIKMI